jgi:hypothetical protein
LAGLTATLIDRMFSTKKKELVTLNERLYALRQLHAPLIRRFQVVFRHYWLMSLEIHFRVQHREFFSMSSGSLVVRDMTGHALRSFASISLYALYK